MKILLCVMGLLLIAAVIIAVIVKRACDKIGQIDINLPDDELL